MNKLPFRLISITDRKLAGKKFLNTIHLISKLGGKCVILREKDLSDREILNLAVNIKSVINPNTIFLVNDRADIAFLSDAYGVHSPYQGLSARLIRRFNDQFIAGKSIHSASELKAVKEDSFNYLIYGPVFKTSSKPGVKPKGLKRLAKICSDSHVPVFAVGGINPSNARECIASGAYGVAVISSLMNSENITDKLKNFREALGGEL